MALGDDVQEKTLKFYVAFKRLRNFARVKVYPSKAAVSVSLRKVSPVTSAKWPGPETWRSPFAPGKTWNAQSLYCKQATRRADWGGGELRCDRDLKLI